MKKVEYSWENQDFRGVKSNNDPIIIEEIDYLSEWDDLVSTMMAAGHSCYDAEIAATAFLSNPDEWPIKEGN